MACESSWARSARLGGMNVSRLSGALAAALLLSIGAWSGEALAACNCLDIDGDGYPDVDGTCTGSSVSQTSPASSGHTITFTFDTSHTCGQFATGDYWVVPNGDGDVDVIAMTPAFSGGKNGYQVNPTTITQGSSNWGVPQRFDSGLDKYTSPASLPLALVPGDVLVKAISRQAPFSANDSRTEHPCGHHATDQCLYYASALTVVPSAVSKPTTAFRPPYLGAWDFARGRSAGTQNRPIYRTSSIDWTVFPRLACAGCTDRKTINSIIRKYKQLHLNYREHDRGRAARPYDAYPSDGGYGGYFSNDTAGSLLRMALDDFNPLIDLSARRAAIHYIQLGIDTYHGMADGNWTAQNGGGISIGYLAPVWAAAYFLRDSTMRAWLANRSVSDKYFDERLKVWRTTKDVQYGDDKNWNTAWSNTFDGKRDQNNVVLWGMRWGQPRQSITTLDGQGSCFDPKLLPNDRTCADPYRYIDGGYNLCNWANHPQPSDYERINRCQMKGWSQAARLFPGGHEVMAFPEAWEYTVRRVFFGAWMLPDAAPGGPRCAGSHGAAKDLAFGGGARCYPGDKSMQLADQMFNAFWDRPAAPASGEPVPGGTVPTAPVLLD